MWIYKGSIIIFLVHLFLDPINTQIVFGNRRQSPRPTTTHNFGNVGNKNPQTSQVVSGGGGGGGTINFGSPSNPNFGSSPSGGVEHENACNCVTSSSCGKGQASHGCMLERGGQRGVCCTESTGVSTRIGAFENARAQSVSENSITVGFERGQQIFNKILQDQAQDLANGRFLARKTPARGHAYFFQRSPSAVEIHKQAYLNARASTEIAKMQDLTPEAASVSLKNINMPHTRRQCLADRQPNCNPGARFRTVDGSCNNIRFPNFGKSETPFLRLSVAAYEDGIMAPRQFSVVGGNLPNVRDVSNVVLLDVDNPSSQLSLNVMQWAQFVDHDLTHAPFPDMGGEAIECCRNGRRVNDLPEGCFPIDVPFDDRFFIPQGQRCINFVRSMLALRPNCAFGPAEQLNALTHWIDGSMVYGSTEEEAEAVREGHNSPFLSVTRGNLPPVDPAIDCEARSGAPCFVGGDSRISEQPALTVMHTIWIREHNRIARELQRRKRLSPEEIFEESRRIVIAQIQHITYNEWLPIILGNVYGQMNIGAPTSYNPRLNPGQLNEFASASFRFGHSLVQGTFQLPSANGRISTLKLRNVFNNPGLLQGKPALLDDFVRGLTQQKMQDLDSFITEELSNHLFALRGDTFGLDLMSLNIQRAREHGIPSYNTIRGELGIGSARDFFDLQSTTRPDLIQRLQATYRNVEDIDLFPGGMTEKRVPGGLLGPTFARLNGRQFRTIRDADRFFYDVQGQPGSFTPSQIREIESTSMAKVFCDNSNPVNAQGVKVMQRSAFFLPGSSNPLLSCDQISGINLNLF